MSWTTPAELRARLRKRWDSQKLLRDALCDELLFPYAVSITHPTRAQLAPQFAEVRAWIDALRAASNEHRTHTYRIEWDSVNLRNLGAQLLPRSVCFDTAEDLFGFIDKLAEFRAFAQLAETTLARWPQAREALAAAPLAVLAQVEHWPKVLAVLDYFAAHPQPGIYLRQLLAPGVDTKFIESRKPLLSALLAAVLPPGAVRADGDARAGHGFERRFGLLHEQPSVRFRLLDPALYVQGMSDIAVPLEQFQRLDLPVRRVFITENKLNGLTFPGVPGALVIFGLGYGLTTLFEVKWLAAQPLYYWGDIDTHGYAMLNRLRARFPHTHAMLMDETTLEVCREFWGEEPEPVSVDLPHLTAAEQDVYQKLLRQHWALRLRLEQERIPYRCVEEYLTALAMQS
ncbi:MAG: hypothetical protein HY273_16500 [Gammaproteobacteria bacterium]|nr:hypothetical protein [Gammaproteobacteria bacterium]